MRLVLYIRGKGRNNVGYDNVQLPPGKTDYNRG